MPTRGRAISPLPWIGKTCCLGLCKNKDVPFQRLSEFTELEQDGFLVTSNHVHMTLLRLVYDDIIRQLLADHVHYWNTNNIRQQKGTKSPGGRPDDLFFNPQARHDDDGRPVQSHSHKVNDEDLQLCNTWIDMYAAERKSPVRTNSTRITRAKTCSNLNHPTAPTLRALLSGLAKPTAETAKSIYKVAYYLYDDLSSECSHDNSDNTRA